MARLISVRAEILRRFRRGHITLVQSYPNRSQPSSDVVPTGRPSGTIAEDGSWRFRQRQGRGTKWHYGNVQHFLLHRQVREEESNTARFVLCVSWIRMELSRCIHIFHHFPSVHDLWCKDVKGATLPWVNLYECCQAWYGMISLQRCLCLLGIHAFVNFASAGDIINCIKTYLLQSIWPARFGNQKWQRKAEGPRFQEVIISVIIDHPPM